MPRIHPAYLVAVVSLVLAGTSAGFAAGSLVTSKEIKDRTIKVKDISPTARAKLRGNTGPAGPAGPQGVTGGQGPRGFSTWDVIPSGTLTRGGWDVDGAAGLSSHAMVNLPGRAPTPIDDAHVVTYNTPHCSGTVFAPQPDPGYVCVSHFATNFTGMNAPVAAAHASPLPDLAFIVVLTNVAGNSAFNAQGAWAYLAP